MLGFATILKLLPHERKQFILHNFDKSFLTNVSDRYFYTDPVNILVLKNWFIF